MVLQLTDTTLQRGDLKDLPQSFYNGKMPNQERYVLYNIIERLGAKGSFNSSF